MVGVQLGPVKTRFIGGASWLRGRDAQIGLIKNTPRALLRKGTSADPRFAKLPFRSLLATFLEQDLRVLGVSFKNYTMPNISRHMPNYSFYGETIY